MSCQKFKNVLFLLVFFVICCSTNLVIINIEFHLSCLVIPCVRVWSATACGDVVVHQQRTVWSLISYLSLIERLDLHCCHVFVCYLPHHLCFKNPFPLTTILYS